MRHSNNIDYIISHIYSLKGRVGNKIPCLNALTNKINYPFNVLSMKLKLLDLDSEINLSLTGGKRVELSLMKADKYGSIAVKSVSTD